jgi:hypothetical protein
LVIGSLVCFFLSTHHSSLRSCVLLLVYARLPVRILIDSFQDPPSNMCDSHSFWLSQKVAYLPFAYHLQVPLLSEFYLLMHPSIHPCQVSGCLVFPISLLVPKSLSPSSKTRRNSSARTEPSPGLHPESRFDVMPSLGVRDKPWSVFGR